MKIIMEATTSRCLDRPWCRRSAVPILFRVHMPAIMCYDFRLTFLAFSFWLDRSRWKTIILLLELCLGTRLCASHNLSGSSILYLVSISLWWYSRSTQYLRRPRCCGQISISSLRSGNSLPSCGWWSCRLLVFERSSGSCENHA